MIMNKNFDDETTQYVDETTQHVDETTQYAGETTTQETDENVSKESNKGEKSQSQMWKQIAVGAASGLLIGSVSTVLMGMTLPDAEEESSGKTNGETTDTHREELSHPEWVDDQVQVATTVNDDMSFGEAFAAARAEVGPGGVFEWHGQLYGTYTAEEWNNMTAEERAEYGDHFSWNKIDHSASDVAQHSTTSGNEETNANDDDIEVISVEHHETAQSEESQVVQAGYTETGGEDVEVEILGVVHDDESGMNIGGMTVGGEDIILVDVDGDMTFDYMAADTNGDGDLSENEFVDIQSEQLTVNDMGGFTNNPTGDMLASNSGPDYIADAAYDA